MAAAKPTPSTLSPTLKDAIQLNVRRRDGKLFANCRYRLYVAGGSTPNPIPIPSGATPPLDLTMLTGTKGKLLLSVMPPVAPGIFASRWDSDDSAYWIVDIAFDYDPAAGTVRLLEGSDGPVNEVQPLKAGKKAGLLVVHEVNVWLSRVRDATGVAYRRAGWTYPQKLDPNLTKQWQYASKPLLSGSYPTAKISRTAALSAPNPDDIVRVFDVAPPRRLSATSDNGEMKKTFRPKLVGHYYPKDVPVDAQPSYLIYYHPQIDQTMPKGGLEQADDAAKSHPNSATYIDWYFNYPMFYHPSIDPWTQPGPGVNFRAGLISQAAASGKKVGVVTPIPEFSGPASDNWADGGQTSLSMGLATDGDFLDELLAEIAAHDNRARGSFDPPPTTSRVAFACFSNGANYLSQTLRSLKAGSKLNGAAKEFYLLDPPSPLYDAVVSAAHKALGSAGADACLRTYSHYGGGPSRIAGIPGMGDYPVIHSALNKAVPLAPAVGAFDDTWEGPPPSITAHMHQTFAYLPEGAWPTAPLSNNKGDSLHAWIAGTMVCHALKMSGF